MNINEAALIKAAESLPFASEHSPEYCQWIVRHAVEVYLAALPEPSEAAFVEALNDYITACELWRIAPSEERTSYSWEVPAAAEQQVLDLFRQAKGGA